MNEKEKRHQYYLAHKDEHIERSARYAASHRKERNESSRRSKAKRVASLNEEQLATYRARRNERARANYHNRVATESPEEREARLASRREYAAARRRKLGICPRIHLTAEEQRAQKAERARNRYYTRYKSDEERKQYERDRKRAYRKRNNNL